MERSKQTSWAAIEAIAIERGIVRVYQRSICDAASVTPQELADVKRGKGGPKARKRLAQWAGVPEEQLFPNAHGDAEQVGQ